MAGLAAPGLRNIQAERFRVLPLWSWSLAVATLVADGDEIVGVGFDPARAVALRKARSEAVEGYVYHRWCRDRISPFTGQHCAAPPSSTGFAAHSERRAAEENAFLEWRERACLYATHAGKVELRQTEIPSLGLLFSVGLDRLGCELRGFLSPVVPHTAFVVGFLRAGVIFGTACRRDPGVSLRAAVTECLRKTAHLKEWSKPFDRHDSFRSANDFWLSSDGRNAMDAFIHRATGNNGDDSSLPAEIQEGRLQTVQVGDHWVCRYSDETFPMPEVMGKVIPLL